MTGFASDARAMSLIAFIAVISVTLLLCVMTAPDRDDLGEFYTGYRSLSPLRNGLAIAGDYVSAATVLSTVGVIALTGYDGLVLTLSTALSLVLLMFLLAEPLRNAGKFTMGDAFARRAPGPAVRVTACLVTLAALLPLMVVQLAGAGDLIAFVLGFGAAEFKTGCIVMLGLLMIGYAAIGGMKGTAFIQAVKTVVLAVSSLAVAALVLHRYGWNPGRLLGEAAKGSGAGPAYLSSGLQFGGDSLDMISSQLTVVIGAASLPHITMRMYSARSARAVRRSLSWAVSAVVVIALALIVIGFGAAAVVGRRAITEADPQGKTSLLLTSQAIVGTHASTLGTLLFTAVATAIFMTLLASISGMTLACANSLAHDLVAHGVRGRAGVRDATETNTARVAALAVGIPAIALAAAAQNHNLQPLVTLSFCLGASALAPALILSLFWRRYTRAGLLCTLIGGTVFTAVVMTGTKLVSGSPQSVFPAHDFNWFPFTTTGIVSIPFGFAAGWLGTALSRRDVYGQRRRYEAVEAWILAGARH
ncbi:cation acetate symporter [Streptomyces noboritoensis]|uniref:Cation acetate symporter n=1 Tax=Streptomyces noboritoensis TaxID=67337 RepID=A0ABV6TQ15_9ACTN